MTLTLEDRSKLAETIVETGGVWLLLFNNRHVKVEPIAVVRSWTGQTLVNVRALYGKSFFLKDNYGEGSFRIRTAYLNVEPERLERITLDKEGVGKKE